MTISTSNRLPKSQPNGLPKSHQISIGGTYALHFGPLNVKHQVYPKVLSKLTGRLNDEAVNQQIFNRLSGQGLFDLVELASIRDQPGTNNMVKLLWSFPHRNTKDILTFLTFLCNLEDMPLTARDIRELIENEFPGSVLPVKRRKVIKRFHTEVVEATTFYKRGVKSTTSLLVETYSQLSLDLLVDQNIISHSQKNGFKRQRISSTSESQGGIDQDQENCEPELKRPVSNCKDILYMEREKKNYNIKVAENKTIRSCFSEPTLLVQQQSLPSLVHFTKEQFESEEMSHLNDSFNSHSVLSYENEHTSSRVSHFADSDSEIAMYKECLNESFPPDSAANLPSYEGIIPEKESMTNVEPEKTPLVKTQVDVIVHESNCESCFQKIRNAFTFKNACIAATSFFVCGGIYFLGRNQSTTTSINELQGWGSSTNMSTSGVVVYEPLLHFSPSGEFPSQNISSTYSPGIVKTEIEQNGTYSYIFSWADALGAQKPKSD